MIRCPNSSDAIFTGHLAAAGAFDDVMAGSNAVGCTVCGELHFWSKAEAWLEMEPDTNAPVAVRPEGI